MKHSQKCHSSLSLSDVVYGIWALKRSVPYAEVRPDERADWCCKMRADCVVKCEVA